MSAERALEILGLTAAASEKELRRAYLRRVKEHPPERDAEGFQQVREAYDFMRQWLWRQGFTAASVPPESPLLETGREVPAAEGDNAAEAAATRESHLEEASRTEPPVDASTGKASANEASANEASGDTTAGGSEAVLVRDPILELIEAINSALAKNDPAAAAEAMVALYERPMLDGAPSPEPVFALRTYLVLIEHGRYKLGRRLLSAFEAHANREQSLGALSSDLGARWKLARELAAVTELDKPLARALAEGLRRAQLFTASDAAQAALDEHGPRFEARMKERAPTLWGAMASLVRRPAQAVETTSPWGFRRGTWPIGVVMMVLFNLIRLAIPDHSSYGSSDSQQESADTKPVVVTHDDPSPPPEAIRAPQADQTEVIQRQISGSWGSLERALRIGDCQTVREQWPLYRVTLRAAHLDPGIEAKRERDILNMCSELKELLEEPE